MIPVFFIIIAHLLNWYGLHRLHSAVNGGQKTWDMLLWAYVSVSLVSYVLLLRAGGKIALILRVRKLGLSMVWSFSILSVYAALWWDFRISPAFVFMGQSAAPLLVGLALDKARSSLKVAWMSAALSVLLLLGFLRGQEQLGGGVRGITMVFFGFLGAQWALRRLLQETSVLECSWLIASTLSMILLGLVVAMRDASVGISGSAFDKFIFAAILVFVQLLVLGGFKRGEILVTSLAQGAGVLVGLILDVAVYHFSISWAAITLSCLYIVCFTRIALLQNRAA